MSPLNNEFDHELKLNYVLTMCNSYKNNDSQISLVTTLNQRMFDQNIAIKRFENNIAHIVLALITLIMLYKLKAIGI